ncbi:hypothetical protein HOLleu_22840 [Holothuria leucospilota]|uniref:Uncharacterized protein n=1 Tax=Holothuria leucospilota TaxID=206669 RepID=A0A9Q1H485_HOLLE|nr:hypothetical protein HOLleu_22840 [Holothuria leucospilota]
MVRLVMTRKLRKMMLTRRELAVLCIVCLFAGAFLLHRRVTSIRSGFIMTGNTSERPQDEFEAEFKDKDLMPPSVENMEETKRIHTIDSPLQYFLTMYTDGLEITWSSDVTTKESLLNALKDYMLMMLEADVQVRWESLKQSEGTAFVSLGTKSSNGMSLNEYLTKIAKFSNKGVKINIPDIDSARVVLQNLNELVTILHSPVWIHANVLPGPNDDSTPVDSRKLFGFVNDLYPGVTLCLGWASDWDPEDAFQRYTWQQVIDMAKVSATTTQPIAFAVRAVFAFNSVRQLKFLLSLTGRFSIYVWISKYDIMQLTELIKFRQFMDHKRVFYNLPPDFLKAVKAVSPEKLSAGSESKKWNRNVWAPVLLDDASLVFLGEDQAALEGSGSWLISKIPFQTELQSSRVVTVAGKVQFLDFEPINSLTSESGVEIFIRSTGVNPPTPDKIRGVVLFIGRDGTITFSERNFKKSGGFEIKTSARLPQNDCYKFNIVDHGENSPIFCEVTVVKCEEDEGTLNSENVMLHLQVAYQQPLFYVVVHPRGLKHPIIIEDLEVVS